MNSCDDIFLPQIANGITIFKTQLSESRNEITRKRNILSAFLAVPSVSPDAREESLLTPRGMKEGHRRVITLGRIRPPRPPLLSSLCAHSLMYSPQRSCEPGAVLILMLQMRRLRHREITSLPGSGTGNLTAVRERQEGKKRRCTRIGRRDPRTCHLFLRVER